MFMSWLACGHTAVTRGEPRPGSWITCPVCQGQRKVLRSDTSESGQRENS